MCEHQVWEMDTAAVADGLCPLCLQARVKELEDAIGEVLDGTLPYLAEKRLKAVLDEVGGK